MGIDNKPEKADGLSIQDPNRPENNISGGSFKATQAFQLFSDAYDTITDCIKRVDMKQDIGSSILACILGGNYSSYVDQRRIMRSLK
jgi:non-canonical poly(A) RNA polymerase PAPD5/7